jgi:hypothetical protein
MSDLYKERINLKDKIKKLLEIFFYKEILKKKFWKKLNFNGKP